MLYEAALRVHGPDIVRAMVHIALNRRLQGSNADGIKMALWLADRAGIFGVIGDPRVTVHDSLGFSQIDDSPIQLQGYAELYHTMETALPLRVPVRVDHAHGASWGECK
jgi:DNA polymerase I-like protein with 3'-5' exonuclease and polymerase domains